MVETYSDIEEMNRHRQVNENEEEVKTTFRTEMDVW